MLTRQTARRRSAIAVVPLGPANGNVEFFAHGACVQPGVDPSIFTSEEDDQQAVAAARAVCKRCPVRLPCRLYAYDVNPYGVYAGETQTERDANLKLRAHLAADEHRRGPAGGAAAANQSRAAG